MPIYEFQCRDCGKEFEEIVLGADETVTCPECGSTATQQLISRCGFKTGGGAPASDGGEAAESKPQYRGIGSSAGCAGCSGGNCSSCG